MATPANTYARLTEVPVQPGPQEKVLLSGRSGTDYLGNLLYPAGTASVGDIVRVFAWGNTQFGTATDQYRVTAYFNPGASTRGAYAAYTGNVPFVTGGLTEWLFFVQITIRATGANGSAFCDAIFLNLLGRGSSSGNYSIPFDSTVDNNLDISLQVLMRGVVTLQQCSVERLPAPAAGGGIAFNMGPGVIDGNVSPATFYTTGSDTGVLSSSTVYMSGTLYGATAYYDVSATGNTVWVDFTYQGAEGGGGVAVGLRWNNSTQDGDFAYIDTNSSPPVIRLCEMTTGWTSGTTAASSSLSLTAGNNYTLVIVDTGSSIIASIADDVGTKTCNITPTVSASNTQIMFGWVGLSASYAFNAAVTAIASSATSTVSTTLITPVAGTYNSNQTVIIATATPAAAIYYTTNGSTPTTSSTPYTGPITVAASQTVKAIAALPGWANSSVASAAYTILPWTMEYGTIDGNSSGNFASPAATAARPRRA